MPAEQIASGTQLVDSVESAANSKKTVYDPDRPDQLYNQPRKDIDHPKKLYETAFRTEDGGVLKPEGWIHYATDRAMHLIVKDRKLALISEVFPEHEHAVWTLPSANLQRTDSADAIAENLVPKSESFASSKYHDRKTLVFQSENVDLLEKKRVKYIDATPDGILLFLNELLEPTETGDAPYVDPSLVAALVRFYLELIGETIEPQLPVFDVPNKKKPVRGPMQESTDNWFHLKSIVVNGKTVEYPVSKDEAFAVGMSVQAWIQCMNELSPMTGKRELYAVSGGVKNGEDSLTAAAREFTEEVGMAGTPTKVIAHMYDNPDSFIHEAAVHIVPNPVVAQEKAIGDEVTVITNKKIQKDEFFRAVANGEFIDDRSIAAIMLSLLYAEQHPEIFL